MPLRLLRWNLSGFRPGSRIKRLTQCKDGCVMELTYHVKEHCVNEEGRRSENAVLLSKIKTWGCGSGNTDDDRLHGGVVGQNKLGQLM